ncbi:Kelch repeat-containing protein [Sorangium sp. So ce1078]|uniref:Kelch repeat-containing protein n=1 Tax=Sorangium sp. So ce1078 TaxID=3133329 RepID=UPI003F62A5BB
MRQKQEFYRGSMRRAGASLAPLLSALALAIGCSSLEHPPSDTLRERFPEIAERVLDKGSVFEDSTGGFSRPAGAACRFRVELPRHGDGAIRFHLPASQPCAEPARTCTPDLEIAVTEPGATGPALRAGRTVAYRRPGGTSLWTAEPGGVEEWLHLEPEVVHRGTAVAAWNIQGAALRQAGDIVLVVDGSGTPRIRITAPEAYAAGGRTINARLAVKGPRMELWVDAEGEEVLVDPRWELTGATMSTPREQHTATLLTSGIRAGQVLVVGGFDGTNGMNIAELFDPVTDTWVSAEAMRWPRYEHTATLLSDGRRVMVIGGDGDIGSAEIYNSDTNTWSDAESIGARSGHTATLLDDGDVLVVGGVRDGLRGDAWRYHDSEHTWSRTEPLNFAHSAHTAARLNNGTILVTGGYQLGDEGDIFESSSAEIYNPTTNRWTNTNYMRYGRADHTATLLLTGDVLVIGGLYASDAEVYHPDDDPARASWSATGPAHDISRGHAAVLLPSTGEVLVTGGFDPDWLALQETTRYNHTTNMWSATEPMLTARQYHTLTRLLDGRILAVGGSDGTSVLSTSELYSLNYAVGVPCTGNGECLSGFCVDGACCEDECAGTCETCETDGICRPIQAGTDPDEECAPDNTSCGMLDFCDGAGACQMQPRGTMCGSIMCDDSILKLPGYCDGEGVCVGNGEEACSPYRCAGDACLSRCTVDADCIEAAYCTAGQCVLKSDEGDSCETLRACRRGTCLHGRCQLDIDNDLTPDDHDNCDKPNPTQEDADGDGLGDACSDDDDGDGRLDAVDNCRVSPNPDQRDENGNGVGDACDCADSGKEGEPCDDRDPCTENDTCENGACRGETHECPPPPPVDCRVRLCVSLSGTCELSVSVDGTPCPGGYCLAGGCFDPDASTSSGAGAGAGEGGQDGAASIGAGSGGAPGAGGAPDGPGAADGEGTTTRFRGNGCALGHEGARDAPWLAAGLLLLTLRRRRSSRPIPCEY